jgi:hypothetical protein
VATYYFVLSKFLVIFWSNCGHTAQGQAPPALPAAIIGIFEDYKGPPYLPQVPKSVPIVPVRREWHANKVHCSRTMLPIILGYALSIHKLQGHVRKNCYISWGRNWPPYNTSSIKHQQQCSCSLKSASNGFFLFLTFSIQQHMLWE